MSRSFGSGLSSSYFGETSANHVGVFGSNESSLSLAERLRSEGYEEYFDPPLENKYECPICLLGLREPVQTPCGHRFCRGCILRSIRWGNTNYGVIDYAIMKFKQLWYKKFGFIKRIDERWIATLEEFVDDPSVSPASERMEELWGVVGVLVSVEELCHWWKYGHMNLWIN